MLKLKSNVEYTDKMDEKIIPLCDAINALPNIYTTESCEGHSCDAFTIFIRVKEKKNGLFFLTRCLDHRYWEYGYLWKLELKVGDMWNGKDVDLPVEFMLHSNIIVGELAYKQAQSLLENMNYHLNHENFMKEFGLNIDDFETEEI